MNDFTNGQQNQNSNSKNGIDDFTTKVLIPLGSIIIGVIGVLISTNKLPAFALWIMGVYLVIVLVRILISPIKNFSSKAIINFSRMRFAKKKRAELHSLSSELNELLNPQRTTTIPYFINNQFSKLSSDLNTLSCLDRNRQQFQILHSWSFSLTELLRNSKKNNLMQNASQLSNLVTWFIWACVWLRQAVNNPVIKIDDDIASDWNSAVQRISDFSSRLERLMKSVNEKYGTNVCTDNFQEVKPL